MSDKILPFDKRKKKASRKTKPRPEPLDIRIAQTIVNTLARDSFNVFIPPNEHAEEQREFRDFTRPDILEILKEGIIRLPPRWENGAWKYRVEVIGFRGRIGAAVVTLIVKSNKELRVATVMWLDRR